MRSKAILSILFFVCFGYISKAQTTINVDASDNASSPKISKYIYSHFAEHLGRGIYDGFYVGDTSKIPMVCGMM
jgi:alpha-N-arabinofuranosidase